MPDGRSVDRRWDWFVSYSHHDVNHVRTIVDALLARGLRVWFAEYLVLLKDWTDIDREFNSDSRLATGTSVAIDDSLAMIRIQEAITQAIATSDHGLVFTSAHCSVSRYCRWERSLLWGAHGPGADHVVEVAVTLDPSAALKLCGAALSLELSHALAQRAEHTRRQILADARLGYAIDIQGWRIVHRGGHASSAQFVEGPTLARTLNSRQLTMNLIIGTGTVVSRPSHESTVMDDDWRLYARAAAWANRFFTAHSRDCRGVHLFSLHGYSHLALTYWLGRAWARRYSIVLPAPRTGESIEFAFAFAFQGPFMEYCRHTVLMDDVVASLKWV